MIPAKAHHKDAAGVWHLLQVAPDGAITHRPECALTDRAIKEGWPLTTIIMDPPEGEPRHAACHSTG